MTTITDHARDELVAVTGRALIVLGEIRVAWAWLRDAREPGGRQRWTERLLTEGQREALDAQAFRERSYKEANRRVGLGALAPQKPAARVHQVDVRVAVVDALSEVAGELHQAVLGCPMPVPAGRVHERPCRYCGRSPHAGLLPVPSTLGERWAPCLGRCLGCRSPTTCRCEPADERVTQYLDRIGDLLPGVKRLDLVTAALAELRRVERTARAAAGADPQPHILIRVQCPACASRSLQLLAESEMQGEWGIVCNNKSCRCSGPGCACGRRSTYRDGEHLWLCANGGWVELKWALNDADGARLSAQLPPAVVLP